MSIIKHMVYLLFIFTVTSNAQNLNQKIIIKESLSCISSNGVPDHKIGNFPNKANPNEFRKQNLTFCFPTNPRFTNTAIWGLMTVGVTITGIPIRPYTAEYFDPNTKRGFSKNPSSGWRKQAMFRPRSLGIDMHNGHVDKSGLYHYHSTSKNINSSKENVLFGYAPDGFKIVYSPSLTSSWQLKAGIRSTPASGVHNGHFEEDFEYHADSGELDECNGKKIDGVYTYFAINTYPFVPRCFKGEINPSFMVRN